MTNPFIQKLSGYVDLGKSEIAALTALTADARSYRARHDLIREGDRPGPVFVVLGGWVCRYKILPNGTRQVMAYLIPGDACDLHVGLLAEMDHSIQTISAATVASVPRDAMEAALDRHRGIAKAMYISQLVDEGTMRAWITSMGRRASIERVAHLMCELYLRAHNIGLATEAHLKLPLSQAMLADSLGMTPVHLNRVLKQLRQHGVMLIERGSLTIIDPVKLVKIAGFDENYLHRRMRLAA